MSAVRVKALDWAKHPRANMWRAVTIIGVYQVAAIIEPADWKFDGVDGGSRGEAENADAAKAAAQADYEARIMSALLPAQTEPDAGRVEGWQPIDTAPKDGSSIIWGQRKDIYGEPRAFVSQGWWVDREEGQVDQPSHDAGFVDCNYSLWHPGRSFGAENSQYPSSQPTHWQPLPTPPSPPREEVEHQGVKAASVNPVDANRGKAGNHEHYD